MLIDGDVNITINVVRDVNDRSDEISVDLVGNLDSGSGTILRYKKLNI